VTKIQNTEQMYKPNNTSVNKITSMTSQLINGSQITNAARQVESEMIRQSINWK